MQNVKFSFYSLVGGWMSDTCWIHKRGLQEIQGGNGKVGKGFRTKVEFELGFGDGIY